MLSRSGGAGAVSPVLIVVVAAAFCLGVTVGLMFSVQSTPTAASASNTDQAVAVAATAKACLPCPACPLVLCAACEPCAACPAPAPALATPPALAAPPALPPIPTFTTMTSGKAAAPVPIATTTTLSLPLAGASPAAAATPPPPAAPAPMPPAVDAIDRAAERAVASEAAYPVPPQVWPPPTPGEGTARQLFPVCAAVPATGAANTKCERVRSAAYHAWLRPVSWSRADGKPFGGADSSLARPVVIHFPTDAAAVLAARQHADAGPLEHVAPHEALRAHDMPPGVSVVHRAMLQFMGGHLDRSASCAICREWLLMPLRVVQLLAAYDRERPVSHAADLHALPTTIGGRDPTRTAARPRVYLEIGASEGDSGSNTWLLDQFLGWKGVEVEPNPPNFSKLLVNRPNAVRLEMACCPAAQTGSAGAGAAGASVQEPVDSSIEFMGDYGNTAAADAMQSADNAAAWRDMHGNRKDTYPVACASLTKYLLAAGVREIDFWSLDVEGSELRVLQSMDFARIAVRMVVVELNPVFAVSALDAVRAHLRGAGFVYLENQGVMNEVYLNTQYMRTPQTLDAPQIAPFTPLI